MHDVVIIGGSYSGVAAAMPLARARRNVLIVDAGRRRNRFAAASHGFLGQDGVDPAVVAERGRQEVLSYPTVAWRDDEAVSAGRDGDSFVVVTRGGDVRARRLVIATGSGGVRVWRRRVAHGGAAVRRGRRVPRGYRRAPFSGLSEHEGDRACGGGQSVRAERPCRRAAAVQPCSLTTADRTARHSG